MAAGRRAHHWFAGLSAALALSGCAVDVKDEETRSALKAFGDQLATALPKLTISPSGGDHDDAIDVQITCVDQVGCARIEGAVSGPGPSGEDVAFSAPGEEISVSLGQPDGGLFGLEAKGVSRSGVEGPFVTGRYSIRIPCED